jgi:uncharacterized protein (DUF1778 family)
MIPTDQINSWILPIVAKPIRHPEDHPKVKSARIKARIAPAALAVVKRAAQLQGRSLSDFIAAALEAAHRAIEETQTIRLSLEDQRRFVDCLLKPVSPNAGLKRAKKAHGRLIQVFNDQQK